MAQEQTRPRIGWQSVFNCYFPSNRHVTITLGTLHPPPLVTRQVVRQPLRQNTQLVEVIDHDVSRCAFDQGAAVKKACKVSLG